MSRGIPLIYDSSACVGLLSVPTFAPGHFLQSLVLLLTLLLSNEAFALYQVMGVYTTDAAASQACIDHMQHPATNQQCWSDHNVLIGSGGYDTCSTQDIRYHSGGYSPESPPNIWPDRYAFITTEDCGGTCPSGYTDNGQGECLEDQQCPVGDKQRFHGDAGDPIPDNVCSNGCWYEVDNVDVPVTFQMGTHAWSGNFISTGASCEAGGGPGGPPDNPPTNCVSDSYGNTFCAGVGPDNAPPNCMEDSNGTQACIDAYDPENCGYINGEPVCFDDYPDNAECYFIPGGSYICFPGNEAPASPPYPDTGTPGDPAEPDVTMEQGDPAGPGGPAPGPIDIFDSDTVNSSSGEGGAPGPGSDTTPPEDPQQIDGDVEIDETGTPQIQSDVFDDEFAGIGLQGVEDAITDIGAGTSTPMPDLPSGLADVDDLLPVVGSCADPTLNFFGQQVTLPFDDKAGGFRDLIGWFFYIVTAFYLFHLVQGLPAKVK